MSHNQTVCMDFQAKIGSKLKLTKMQNYSTEILKKVFDISLYQF